MMGTQWRRLMKWICDHLTRQGIETPPMEIAQQRQKRAEGLADRAEQVFRTAEEANRLARLRLLRVEDEVLRRDHGNWNC